MKIIKVLETSFLFRGIEEKELTDLLSHNSPELLQYKRGELIYSSESIRPLVGFVISGECEVIRERSDGSTVLLNCLSAGESFGILSVFSDEEFPTRVLASRGCEIAFFTDEQIGYFISASGVINMNLITFMAGRIAFLNKRIATFSGSRATDRLAAYLLIEMAKYGKDSFPFSYVKCGEEINAGRASVYRAVASLEAEGLINVTDKKVQILDPQGLERITNI